MFLNIGFVLALLFRSTLSVSALSAHGLTTDAKTFAENTFDFVIIGGGTAGLTVANRLSDSDNKFTVGVIDAGQLIENEPLIDIPLNAGLSLGNPKFDWNFATVPQPNVAGRVIAQPRGKVLGGSSGINYMVYDRASKAEYDAWSSPLLGNSGSGWDWNGLLPYFKKHEDVQPGPPGIFGVPQPQGTDTQFQGKGGPIKVGYSRFYSALFNPFVNTFTKLFGVKINLESEGGDATGLFNCQRSVDDKTAARSYALTGYFLPVQGRTNLLVLTGAEATKINFSGKNPNLRATSVQFVSQSKTYSVKANREVILSAGTYKSPQLLELSGIGGKSLLNKLKIPVLNDLPQVGENLQDHTLLATNFLLKDPAPLTYDELTNNATFFNEALAEYTVNHTGILTATNPGITFNPIDKFVTGAEKNSMLITLAKEVVQAHSSLTPFQIAQYAIQSQYILGGKIGQLEMLFGPGFGGTIGTPIPGRSYLSFGLIGLHPFSRGSVHINSTVGTASPVIDPRYFSFSWDKEVMKIGAKAARKLTQTEPLASFVDAPFVPPPSTSSDADFEEFVNQFTISTFHPIGTASMAPKDRGGVVDKKLLVYGTTNLRVVDASIMPLLIATHLQATVYAIAEKGADIIKAANRSK